MSRVHLHGGLEVDLLAPGPLELPVTVLAHHLSHLCRATGGTRAFYSVAQHSLLVSYLVPQRGTLPLQGLLHDMTEAVMGDLSTPVKALFPEYKRFEQRLYARMSGAYGLPTELDPEVKLADTLALRWEAGELMTPPWTDVDPSDVPLRVHEVVRRRPATRLGWTPGAVRQAFEDRFHSLTVDSWLTVD
jgi:hypothetical protein